MLCQLCRGRSGLSCIIGFYLRRILNSVLLRDSSFRRDDGACSNCGESLFPVAVGINETDWVGYKVKKLLLNIDKPLGLMVIVSAAGSPGFTNSNLELTLI
jgi:hypothetical protein